MMSNLIITSELAQYIYILSACCLILYVNGIWIRNFWKVFVSSLKNWSDFQFFVTNIELYQKINPLCIDFHIQNTNNMDKIRTVTSREYIIDNMCINFDAFKCSSYLKSGSNISISSEIIVIDVKHTYENIFQNNKNTVSRCKNAQKVLLFCIKSKGGHYFGHQGKTIWKKSFK